jgi:hypothetical protein
MVRLFRSLRTRAGVFNKTFKLRGIKKIDFDAQQLQQRVKASTPNVRRSHVREKKMNFGNYSINRRASNSYSDTVARSIGSTRRHSRRSSGLMRKSTLAFSKAAAKTSSGE